MTVSRVTCACGILGEGICLGGTYVCCRNGHRGREQEDDGHEGRPEASPRVDVDAGLAEMPGAGLELAVEDLADDRDAVRPIQANGTDVEHGRDGDAAAQSDEVDQDAQERVEPDGQNWRAGLLPNLVPDTRAGQHLISREGPDGPGTGLKRSDTDEVHDEEGCDGEKDGSLRAQALVEDLHNL